MASKWPRAWRYLSKNQKRDYANFRRGLDGEKAYYWYIQEVGNEAAGVKGQFYIEKAVKMWQPMAESRVHEYLKAAWNDVSKT